MFPKKKKQDPPEIQKMVSEAAPLPAVPQAGQSLFAPGLNPAPMQIDFFSSALPSPQPMPFPAPQQDFNPAAMPDFPAPDFSAEPLPPLPQAADFPAPVADPDFDPDYIPEHGSLPPMPPMPQPSLPEPALAPTQDLLVEPAMQEPAAWTPTPDFVAEAPPPMPEAFSELSPGPSLESFQPDASMAAEPTLWQPDPVIEQAPEAGTWQPESAAADIWQAETAPTFAPEISDPAMWQPEAAPAFQTETFETAGTSAWQPSEDALTSAGEIEFPAGQVPWSSETPSEAMDFQPTLEITPLQEESAEAWQPTELDHSDKVAGLYPPEYNPQTTEAETWQPPGGMDLPPQVEVIYPSGFATPEAAQPMPPGDLSPEALWHQMQPTMPLTTEQPAVIEDPDFSGNWEMPTAQTATSSSWTETDSQAWDMGQMPAAPAFESETASWASTADAEMPASPVFETETTHWATSAEPEMPAPSATEDLGWAVPQAAPESITPIQEMTMVFPASPEQAEPPAAAASSPVPEPDTWSQPLINPVTWESPTPLQEATIPTAEAPPEMAYNSALEAQSLTETYPEVSFEDSFGVGYLNEPDTPSAPPEGNLWNNLQSPASPGQQVPADPMSSGQFLDSVSSQLYPDDPFSLDSTTLSEGEQAFEDAAQFLFPETMRAPLEWSDSTDRLPHAEAMPGSSLPQEPSMELGPSYQLESPSFNEISPDYGIAPQPVGYTPEAPSAPVEPSVPPPSITESIADLSPNLNDTAATDSQPFFPDADYTPSTIWFSDDDLDADTSSSTANSAGTYDSILGPLSVEESQSRGPVNHDGADQDSLSAYFEEQDFYTPSYALDDKGEIVTEHEEYIIPQAEGESSFETLWSPSPTQPAAQAEEASFSSWSLDEDETDSADVPVYSLEELAATVQPPATELTPPGGDLEEAWNISPGADIPPTSPVESPPTTAPQQPVAASPPATTFSMENLEIIGVCPLEAEKRLLLVKSNETYALMGQAGVQNPNVSVLKIFEHNPTAYQNTFTAVAEGQSGNQGMYVVQVGTWHAILSTFQQNILLHTELG